MDTQALPIPEIVEAETKVKYKPPIPEKPVSPVGSPSYEKEFTDKLYLSLQELVNLIKDQKPSLAPQHPLIVKCNQIESSIFPDKPPLPTKPTLPEKPKSVPVVEQSPATLARRRRPPSMQVALPSVVINELSDTIHGTATIGTPDPRAIRKNKPSGRGSPGIPGLQSRNRGSGRPRGAPPGTPPVPERNVSNPSVKGTPPTRSLKSRGTPPSPSARGRGKPPLPNISLRNRAMSEAPGRKY